MPRPKLIELTEGRQNNFDFIRFFLASAVLFFHSIPVLHGTSLPNNFWDGKVAPFFGVTSVDMFFVISGFLVTNSWVRSPHGVDYLKKRVLRIYPAYIGLSLVTALIIGPIAADTPSLYWHQFPKFAFLSNIVVMAGPYVISPIFGTLPLKGMVNASVWTLRYEFWCYLLVMALGLVSVYRKRGLVLGMYAIACVMCILQTSGLHTIAHHHIYKVIGIASEWIRLIASFLAGMTAYLFRDKLPYSPALAGVFAILTVVLVGVEPAWANALAPILYAYALIIFAFSRSIKLQNWAKYGDFSYGVYLYAFPIQQLVTMFAHENLSVMELSFIAYPITIACAAFSWHLIERPALMLKGVGAKPNFTQISSLDDNVVARRIQVNVSRHRTQNPQSQV